MYQAKLYRNALSEDNREEATRLFQLGDEQGIYGGTNLLFPDGSRYICRETLNVSSGHGFTIYTLSPDACPDCEAEHTWDWECPFGNDDVPAEYINN